MLKASHLAALLLIVGLVLGGGIGYSMAPGATTTTETVERTVSTTLTETVTAKETTTLTTTTTATKTTTTTTTTTVTETVTTTVIQTPPPPPEIFTLHEYRVVVKDSVPSLYVSFETSKNVKISLIGPDGEEKSFEYVTPEEKGVYLSMSGFGETPLSGTYRLVVSLVLGAKVFEEEFSFKGYDVSVVSVKPVVEEFILKSLNITLVNSGDLPTFIKDGILYLDGKTETIPFFYEPVPVGKISHLISTFIYLGKPSAVAKLELYNDLGEKIAEYTFTITT